MYNRVIKYLRLFHRLNSKDVCSAMGVSASYISGLENGNRAVTLKTLEKYSEVFNIPASSIVAASEKLEGKDIESPEWFPKFLEWMQIQELNTGIELTSTRKA